MQHEDKDEDFTISVEQVREHLRSKGLHKSKDTVQRWCRTGDLTCQKKGVLNRYFTTEASLKKLEQKLLPDMVAEGAGETKQPAVSALPLHADAPASNSMQVHAGADTAVRSGTQQDLQMHAAAPDPLELSDQIETPSRPASAEVQNLKEQLKSKDSEIEFLREEIRAARSERSNVVQISHRMMEAMETMVVGGKVDRLNTVESSSNDPQQSTNGYGIIIGPMTHIGDHFDKNKFKRRPRYTIVLHDVREQLGLSTNTYIVIDSIHKLCTTDRNFPYCVMSKEGLADFLRLGRATVFRSIKEAEEAGLIEREPRKGLRTTQKWINTVELFSLDADR
ncbi:hypothetical protein [uncultured Tateyamaria sp.]|uniref:hypothetical protein n=1 Tax=uncultured Tateyamaria sp. TaxID=455651 RepID=UPI00262198B2|nr:hypothetical protein [uncultured Tateyamaria sp.]